jgi:outer membrane protein insertion porin family
VRSLLIALLLFPLVVGAQTRPARKATPKPKPAAAAAFPIESISIEGAQEYTREQILTAAQVKVGQSARAAEFEAARKRLEATGVFDEVGVRFAPGPGGKGYAVTIQVREAGPFYPVQFQGFDAPAPELARVLRQTDPFFGPHIPATELSLARYAKALEAWLATENRPAKVSGRLLPDDTGQMVIVFRPPVALSAIARVRFENVKTVRLSVIENAINAIVVGVPYEEKRLRHALDLNVRPLFEVVGLVRVAFPEIKTEKEKDVTGLVVTVKVEEGPVYQLGDVTLTGSAIPSAELLKVGAFKPGTPFDLHLVQAAVARVEQALRRNGFMKVSSRVERRIDDTAKKVHLALQIQDGPRYTMGKLEIQGLDIISEPAIRKMWATKPGQPFNADYPNHFLDVVRQEALFDDLGETKAVIKTDDEAHIVDVTLIFKGAPRQPAKPREP